MPVQNHRLGFAILTRRRRRDTINVFRVSACGQPAARRHGILRRVWESLAALKHRWTLCVVAHRISTLVICERVTIIVDGRLQAVDAPGTLLSDSPYYRSASVLTTLPMAPG